MKQRVHLITLGVDDLDRARAFYEALGWAAAEGSPDNPVIFQLHGAVLGLYRRADLEAEVGQPIQPGGGAMALAHNVDERDDVAAVLAAAEAAGATVVKPSTPAFWGGQSGYFRDPEGFLWEVAWNPFSPLGPEGQFRWGGFDAPA